MDNSVKITLIIVAAVLLVLLVGYGIYSGNSTKDTISANGQAQVKAIPDRVKVYFNLEVKADSAQEARTNVSSIYDNLQTALIKLGFVREDIQTQSLSVNPNQVWTGSGYVNRGYTASQQVILDFSANDSDKISDVIDAGIGAGAGISYINFELSISKQNEYKALAYKQAAEDARVKASSIAEGSGKKLGKLYSISSQEFYYQPYRVYDMVNAGNAPEAKAVTSSIQPSSEDISAQVSAVYKLV